MKTVYRKVNVSLEENLLNEIDDFCDRHGMSRSGFLSLAARDRLGADTARESLRSTSELLKSASENLDLSKLDESERRAFDAMSLLSSFFEK